MDHREEPMFQDHFGGKALVALALGAGLAGCGGGGGGSTPGDSITTQLSPACTGASCGATDATTYSGQGVGVWSYTNATAAEQPVAVGLRNLGTRPVTLIYTNTGDAAVADRKSTRLNSSHLVISYAVFCLKKKKRNTSPFI